VKSPTPPWDPPPSSSLTPTPPELQRLCLNPAPLTASAPPDAAGSPLPPAPLPSTPAPAPSSTAATTSPPSILLLPTSPAPPTATGPQLLSFTPTPHQTMASGAGVGAAAKGGPRGSHPAPSPLAPHGSILSPAPAAAHNPAPSPGPAPGPGALLPPGPSPEAGPGHRSTPSRLDQLLAGGGSLRVAQRQPFGDGSSWHTAAERSTLMPRRITASPIARAPQPLPLSALPSRLVELMHPHGPPALPAANTRHPGTTAQLLSPAPAGMARAPAPGPGGVQLQLQQAFLSQYSTDDQPVRLREVVSVVAELLATKAFTSAMTASLPAALSHSTLLLKQEAASAADSLVAPRKCHDTHAGQRACSGQPNPYPLVPSLPASLSSPSQHPRQQLMTATIAVKQEARRAAAGPEPGLGPGPGASSALIFSPSELEACRAWLLCCLDSLSSRSALHQLATAAPLLEVGISAAATAALCALLPTSLPDAVVRVAGEVAAQLALVAAAQRLVQQVPVTLYSHLLQQVDAAATTALKDAKQAAAAAAAAATAATAATSTGSGSAAAAAAGGGGGAAAAAANHTPQ
ncbi:hypothetical protein QJQ45_017403, partial [Haematococcus lacustris]